MIPGVALFVLGALVFLLAAMQSSFDPHEVWEQIEWEAASTNHLAPTRYKREQQRECPGFDGDAARSAEL